MFPISLLLRRYYNQSILQKLSKLRNISSCYNNSYLNHKLFSMFQFTVRTVLFLNSTYFVTNHHCKSINNFCTNTIEPRYKCGLMPQPPVYTKHCFCYNMLIIAGFIIDHTILTLISLALTQYRILCNQISNFST